MSADEPAIIIAGERGDWPGGAGTLRPRRPTREPNGALWFGTELEASGDQVWFRIEEEDVGRLPGNDPGARGRLLVDALLARVKRGDIQIQSAINRFEVRVSETGAAWIERLRW